MSSAAVVGAATPAAPSAPDETAVVTCESDRRPTLEGRGAGLFYYEPDQRWLAQISVGPTLYGLGLFRTEAAARRSYEGASRRLKDPLQKALASAGAGGGGEEGGAGGGAAATAATTLVVRNKRHLLVAAASSTATAAIARSASGGGAVSGVVSGTIGGAIGGAIGERQQRAVAAGVTSSFRGVSWSKQSRKWQSQIKIGGKTKHLGVFSDEEVAARAYDVKATVQRGDRAVLNFPPPGAPTSRDARLCRAAAAAASSTKAKTKQAKSEQRTGLSGSTIELQRVLTDRLSAQQEQRTRERMLNKRRAAAKRRRLRRRRAAAERALRASAPLPPPPPPLPLPLKPKPKPKRPKRPPFDDGVTAQPPADWAIDRRVALPRALGDMCNVVALTAGKPLAQRRFRGVSWHRTRRKWEASIESIRLGLFDDETAAARAYDDAARRLCAQRGKPALFNFAAARSSSVSGGTAGTTITATRSASAAEIAPPPEWSWRNATADVAAAAPRAKQLSDYLGDSAERAALLRELAFLRSRAALSTAKRHRDWSEHTEWWRRRAGEFYGRSRLMFKEWGSASYAASVTQIKYAQRNAPPVRNSMRPLQAQFHPCFVSSGVGANSAKRVARATPLLCDAAAGIDAWAAAHGVATLLRLSGAPEYTDASA
jgi:hypothetical protein